jgi:hypothetical protein
MLSVVAVTLSAGTYQPAQSGAFEARELAEYRLTAATFERFVAASEQIAIISRQDRTLSEQPLFTRDVSVLGEATAVAGQLETRLSGHAALANALSVTGITAREYTKFALTLFGARLAHGFLSTGALRSVPKGVATDNVEFVKGHLEEVIRVLHALGVEEPPPVSAALHT